MHPKSLSKNSDMWNIYVRSVLVLWNLSTTTNARYTGRMVGAGMIDLFIEAFVVDYIFLSALDARKNSS